ncbi:DUF350 domain-containing protein [Pseudonocardiaceae bacterium YIM PH 21723]|nr:DUF350 domain-containing protein [Pseudonocardiaceae bacterium YIM PH 21723]
MLIGFWAIDLTTPGKLYLLVREGRPNAVAVSAAGLISMAFVVVIAINAWGVGQLWQGLIASLIYGLVGIVVQVIAVMVMEWAAKLDMDTLLHEQAYKPLSLVIAAAHIAMGLVVAVAVS